MSRFRATAHVHNGQILDGFSSVGRGYVFFGAAADRHYLCVAFRER